MKKILFLLTIILSLSTLSGCNDNDSELDELESMRQRWEKMGLQDYAYEAGYNCYCGGTGPYTLEFVDGELDTVYLSDSETTDIDYDALLEMTQDLVIEALFNKIKENIDRNPHSFNVDYDHQYFFPKEAYFDFDEHIADEELGYYIRDFSITLFK